VSHDTLRAGPVAVANDATNGWMPNSILYDRNRDFSAGLLWMAPALQEIFDDGVGRVQSSVRPVGAVEMTAGPDGVRELGPILLIRL
jgi:hypothetical protein